MRSYWKDSEITYLKNNFYTLTINEIAHNLDRSPKSVKSKAYREGLVEINDNSWSDKDLAYLEDKWGVVSIDGIAEKLGRTSEAVRYKAYRLGFSGFTYSIDGITLNELSKAIYVEYGRIKRWKKSYKLPTKKKNITHRCKKEIINIDDFWKWASKHRFLIDFSLIERNVLGAEPFWVAECRKEDFRNKEKIPFKKWSEEEDKKLIELVNQYKYTYEELAKLLHRTERSIVERLSKLGILARPLPRHIKGWSDDEIKLLLKLRGKGLPRREIAKVLNRSAMSITHKLRKISPHKQTY